MPSCWMARGVNSQIKKITTAFLRNQVLLAHKNTNTKNGTTKITIVANSSCSNDLLLKKCATRVETATKIINHHIGNVKIAVLRSKFGLSIGVFDWLSNDFISSAGLGSKNSPYLSVTGERSTIVTVKWRAAWKAVTLFKGRFNSDQ
jgi:hypothetical protein